MTSVHEPKRTIDTLIISDIHCGLDYARVEAAADLLKKRDFKRLVLLGDVFNRVNFKKLRKRDFELLREIRKIGEKESGIKAVWIVGNHDEELGEFDEFLGITLKKEFEWEEGGKKCLALHGDMLYDFQNESKFLALCYLLASALLPAMIMRKISFSLKNTFVTKNASEKLKDRALLYGKEKGADRIFCGHSHVELHAERDGVEYWNSGSWLGGPAPYIAITDGKVEMRFV